MFFVKHGSWLDMAEIELNVMTRQCLSRRISTLDKLKCELSAWEMERNRDTAKIQWHFQTGDAREKLISLYPTPVCQAHDKKFITFFAVFRAAS